MDSHRFKNFVIMLSLAYYAHPDMVINIDDTKEQKKNHKHLDLTPTLIAKSWPNDLFTIKDINIADRYLEYNPVSRSIRTRCNFQQRFGGKNVLYTINGPRWSTTNSVAVRPCRQSTPGGVLDSGGVSGASSPLSSHVTVTTPPATEKDQPKIVVLEDEDDYGISTSVLELVQPLAKDNNHINSIQTVVARNPDTLHDYQSQDISPYLIVMI